MILRTRLCWNLDSGNTDSGPLLNGLKRLMLLSFKGARESICFGRYHQCPAFVGSKKGLNVRPCLWWSKLHSILIRSSLCDELSPNKIIAKAAYSIVDKASYSWSALYEITAGPTPRNQ